MAEVNLLRSLPKTQRKIEHRLESKTAEIIKVAREFGEAYFDGPRYCGYGGYYYDGRWQQVACDIITHFNLKRGDYVLDIGCAKGFLVKDLLAACPGLEVYGIDISTYALNHAEQEAKGRLICGNALSLPFVNGSFTAALAINTLHNLPTDLCIAALREIERLAPRSSFVQVDAYQSEAEKTRFLEWMLTAETHGYPEDWLNIFNSAGYKGDWFWTSV